MRARCWVGVFRATDSGCGRGAGVRAGCGITESSRPPRGVWACLACRGDPCPEPPIPGPRRSGRGDRREPGERLVTCRSEPFVAAARVGCRGPASPALCVCVLTIPPYSSTRYNPTQLLRVVPATSVRARTMQCQWPISIAHASQPSHHLSRPSSPSCRPIGFACRTATGRAPSAVQVARSKTASGLAEGPSERTAVQEGGTDPLSVCRAARTS